MVAKDVASARHVKSETTLFSRLSIEGEIVQNASADWNVDLDDDDKEEVVEELDEEDKDDVLRRALMKFRGVLLRRL